MGIVIKGHFDHPHSCLQCLCANGPRYTPMLMEGPRRSLRRLRYKELSEDEGEALLARLNIACRCLWQVSGDTHTRYDDLWAAVSSLLKMEATSDKAKALQAETRLALKLCEQEAFENCQRPHCPQAKKMREANKKEP